MMALRNTKITREVLQTCNRFLSTKAEISSIKNAKSSENAPQTKEDSPQFRYIVTTTTKQDLPKIEFHKEPEELIPPEMRHLQPSMLPKYIEMEANQNKDIDYEYIAEREVHNPFPEPIKELRTKTITISDKKKAEMKSPSIRLNLKKNNVSYTMHKNYSTVNSPFLTVNRSFASKKSSKGAKDEKCENQPKYCKKNTSCPSFIMKECEPTKGSDCRHNYIDPKCTKKMAPYPSYSEACAERLPDDPSECMQCPWSKCGGTDAIKPPKRHYHTKAICNRWLQNDFVIPPYLDMIKCEATKDPCKAPPNKCEKEDPSKKKHKKNDHHKKHDEPCKPNPAPKKCQGNSWMPAYELWAAKENILPDAAWTIIETENMDQSVNTTLSKCNKESLHLIKDHDKGHPPPCSSYRKPSKQCPKEGEEKKRPYRKERDLDYPYYPKNKEPWSEEDK